MDRFIEILFNTNHEMPSPWVIALIVVICIAVSAFSRYVQDKHSRSDYDQNKHPESSGQKKSKGKKKK